MSLSFEESKGKKSENIFTLTVLDTQLLDSRINANYFVVGKLLQASEFKDEINS